MGPRVTPANQPSCVLTSPFPCRARVGVQKALRREFAALLRKHVELAVQVSIVWGS